MKIRHVSMTAFAAALVAGGAWAEESQTGASASASASLAFAPVALPIDGSWLLVDVFMNEGDFFPDDYTINNAEPVTVRITDWAVVTDVHNVYNNSVLLFETVPNAPANNWDDLGFADPFDSPPFTFDGATAWADARFSKGWVTLPAGSHSIEIENLQIPPTAGGTPFPDSTVALSASYVPDCDIKPGSFPNSININKKKGVIPVALLGSANVDVTAVDVSTLEFEGASPDHDLLDATTYLDHLQDVNLDTYMDLVSHYRAQDTDLNGASTDGTITGEIGGIPFSCTDSVRIVGGGN